MVSQSSTWRDWKKENVDFSRNCFFSKIFSFDFQNHLWDPFAFSSHFSFSGLWNWELGSGVKHMPFTLWETLLGNISRSREGDTTLPCPVCLPTISKLPAAPQVQRETFTHFALWIIKSDLILIMGVHGEVLVVWFIYFCRDKWKHTLVCLLIVLLPESDFEYIRNREVTISKLPIRDRGVT